MGRPSAGSLGRLARRGARLRPRDWLTTLHVLAVLAVVESLIRWVPIQPLSRFFGVRVSLEPTDSEVAPFPLDDLPRLARRQLRCTRRVADIWPLSKGPCLRRSLVAGHLLRRYRPALRIGVGAIGNELVAHAWIEIDDRPLESVAGYEPFQHRQAGASA